MGKPKLEIVDVDTGEIIKASKRAFKAEWFKGDINGSEVLAKLNLSKNEYRVIFMLLSKLNYNNRIFLNISSLAEHFECDRSMLYKTINSLEEKRVLLKIGNFHKFNNTYVRCGGDKHEE